MEKKDMLEIIINHYEDGNKAQFAKRLGISPQALSMWFTRNSFDAELLYTKCEGLSGDWLLSGEGEMLKSSQIVNNPNGSNIDFSDINMKKMSAKVVVEFEVTEDQFIKMGLKDNLVQVLNKK